MPERSRGRSAVRGRLVVAATLLVGGLAVLGVGRLVSARGDLTLARSQLKVAQAGLEKRDDALATRPFKTAWPSRGSTSTSTTFGGCRS